MSAYWPKSVLNTINLNTNYIKLLDINKIEKHIWYIGGNSEEKMLNQNAKEVYENEVGINALKEETDICYNKEYHIPSKCVKGDLWYSGYIGLMYISDYFYSALPQYWNLVGCDMPLGHKNVCSSSGGKSENDYRSTLGNNWLHIDSVIAEWAITNYDSNAFYIYQDGSIYSRNPYNYSYPADNNFFVRPVFYLKTNVDITLGAGTKENPFIINLDTNSF